MSSYSVNVSDGITLITLNTSDITVITKVLDMLSQAKINVDMIAASPPQGVKSTFSFTISDDDFEVALEVISSIHESYSAIKPIISSKNSKVLIYGEQMRTEHGFAAKVLKAISSIDTDVRLITTSETDISILVTSADGLDVSNAIKKII